MTRTTQDLKHKLRGLYAITDQHLISEADFSQAIEAALQGGVSIIQYRDKSDDQDKRFRQASLLRKICNDHDSICIINDDIELAQSVDADGVHIGKDDHSLKQAREALGDDAIIGVSCYNDIGLALAAEKNSADYVAFGTMFSSPTKPDAVMATPRIISEAKRQLNIPVCGIGGITEENIHQLIQHDTDMAAVISSLFAADDIQQRARLLSQHFS